MISRAGTFVRPLHLVCVLATCVLAGCLDRKLKPLNPCLVSAVSQAIEVNNLTAYNNIQLLSLSPGSAVLDVLSDEFSPYANIFPNNATALVQSTDVEPFALKFNDFADSAPEPGSFTFLLAAGVVALSKRSRANTANT